jgi:hypothetical protein
MVEHHILNGHGCIKISVPRDGAAAGLPLAVWEHPRAREQ